MGISCLGDLLAMDAEGALDEHSLALLYALSSCSVSAVVAGKTSRRSGDDRLCSRDVYIPRSEFADEEFSLILMT